MNNEEYAIPRAIVFSNGNVQVVGKILYYPIYMLMYLQPEMIKKPIFRFEPIQAFIIFKLTITLENGLYDTMKSCI